LVGFLVEIAGSAADLSWEKVSIEGPHQGSYFDRIIWNIGPVRVGDWTVDRNRSEQKNGLMGYNQIVDAGEAGPTVVARLTTMSALSARLTRLILRVAMVACCLTICVPLVQLGTATAAGAAAAASIPVCPPDCGFVAAGDPLLIPFMADNPGNEWRALPASDVQSYVDTLKRNLAKSDPKVGSNVAAAKWLWFNGQYGLMIVLVSSPDLAHLHLGTPAQNAQDLCTSSHGRPVSRLEKVAGVADAVSGECAVRPTSTSKEATVVAFNRGNVAVLIEITSKSGAPIASSIVATAAQQESLTLPSEGVPVSSGGLDIGWVLIWLVVLAAILAGVLLCVRRRGSWRGPVEAVVASFDRRKLALGITLLAVIGAMAFSMVNSSLLHGQGEWYEAGFDDLWRNWADAAYMTFAGGYGHIYILDRSLETAPALQLVTAPVARLAFHLSFPYPSPVLYPEAFWVAGPLFLSAMALPICAADRWLQGMAVVDLRRRLLVLGAMAITLPPIALSGHPEDLIAIGAMLYGLVAALDGRPRAVGWWLGVALAFQFFALLAVPFALVFLSRRKWLTAIWPMILVPLTFLVVPLIAEPSETVRQLIHQRVYDVSGYITPTWRLDPGVGAFIRALVVLLAIPAAIIVARHLPRSRRTAANLVVWTLAALLALRVFEPQLVTYFLAPVLALMPVSASRGPWWRLIATCLAAVWLNWWVHIAVDARWSLWLILIGQLAVLGWLGWPAGLRSSGNDASDTQDTEKKPPRAAPTVSSRERSTAGAR
jgi:hypothetical protein